MNIDKNRLESLIANALDNVGSKHTPWLDETILIGEIDDLQIQLKVTGEEVKFIDEINPINECVTA